MSRTEFPSSAPRNAVGLATPEARNASVALIGNPNTGKSTLFSALSGIATQTGNYPGVTVEKKVGRLTLAGRTIDLIDLPGTYSLSPRSLDEMVTVDVLLGRRGDTPMPSVVICILDASNIERNLYLVSQILDTGRPVIVALNMMDIAEARNIRVSIDELSKKLSVPVIPIQAHKKFGVADLKQAIETLLKDSTASRPGAESLFPPVFQTECAALVAFLAERGVHDYPVYLCERLLLDVHGWLETSVFPQGAQSLALNDWLTASRERLRQAGCKVPAIEATVRYKWARGVVQTSVVRPKEPVATRSDRIDRVLTHWLSGFAFFFAIMFVVFQSIFTIAPPLGEAVSGFLDSVGDVVGSRLPSGPLSSLWSDGIVAGVGGVLVFVPQIAVLFLFIAILEDCGYMARAAFLMDRLMTRVGLSGKSFVPLMSSFACAIPGIMATRTIENRRDRMTTILVSPLMSCSARQPVYALMIAGFVPAVTWLGGLISLQGLVLFALTSLGAFVAIPIAWLLRGTVFRGEVPPFVLELPSYKWPSWRVVAWRVYSQVVAFTTRAGTMIFATTVLIWAAGYFPGDRQESIRLANEIVAWKAMHPDLAEASTESPPDAAAESKREADAATNDAAEPSAAAVHLDELQTRQRQLDARLLEDSYLGRFGKLIEPAVRPLGWDWRIGVGVIASFPAREVIIGTLGTIYSLGGDVDEKSTALQSTIQTATWPDGRKVYNLPVALSLMVFFALCAQCASTLMVIRRETGSWLWPVVTFTYMTLLAYAAAAVTYQVASLFAQ